MKTSMSDKKTQKQLDMTIHANLNSEGAYPIGS